MGLVDPKTCVYQFIFDENDSNDTKIIQYFIMHVLGLCKNLNNFVAHIFYYWLFSTNKEVPFDIKHNKCFLSLNKYTTLFACGSGHSNKNRTQ